MASSNARVRWAEKEVDWRTTGLRYYPLSRYLRQRFGGRVHKVSLDAGFTCPHLAPARGGGCIFCDNRSFSPGRRLAEELGADLEVQLREGIGRVAARYGCEKFLAYFQAATNTLAPVARLRRVYEQALAHPQVVGLAISTRPDCLPDDVLDLLADLARRTFVCLEIGLQSVHDRSLAWLGRDHDAASFFDSVGRAAGRGFDLGVHVILGIPGESRDEMLETARHLARLPLDAVKIHHLYAVRDTVLGTMVERGQVELLSREAFVDLVVEFLECLPPTMRIDRIGGDAPPDFLIAPQWSLDRSGLRDAVAAELARRDTWQGRCYPAGT